VEEYVDGGWKSVHENEWRSVCGGNCVGVCLNVQKSDVRARERRIVWKSL
jgi:hypothetical protein